jgi:ubiquinone/menaquinone biosynthesis C-methylase UbiE
MRNPEQESAGAVRHPLFARMWKLMARHEPAQETEHRRRALAGLSGRVIEVGAGTGSNFKHYPDGVTEVVAVEPEPILRAEAVRAAAAAAVPVRVIDGTAERLPAQPGEFDAAIACLVLCSVADPGRALAELQRVIRPGGELRYYEHVVSRRPGLARSQRLVDHVWPHAFGNCHTSRDTEGSIRAAGFVVEHSEHLWAPPCPLAAPVGPRVIGVARRSG